MRSPDRADTPAAEPVHLGPSAADLVSLLVLAPLIGMGVGLVMPWVAMWVEDLPWVPFQGPLELVASMPWGWATAAGCVAGLVFGAGLAVVTIRDALRVVVAPEAVSFDKRGVTRVVAHSDVSAVFLVGGRLVVVDGASREVLCDEVDAKPERIEEAFRSHTYPWRQDDPYAEAFQRWVPETPDLPGSVNAVFAARETSLLEKNVEDADDLRSELLKKGFVARDQKARQYWRSLQ
jgi:hypothetical protein